MKILLPRRNAGALGFVFKSGLYLDFWKGFDNKWTGMFISDHKKYKVWVNFKSGRIRVHDEGGDIDRKTCLKCLIAETNKEE